MTVGIIFRFWKCAYKEDLGKSIHFEGIKKTPPKLSDLGGILQTSIMSSIKTVVMIGGFVIFFSIIISIFNNTGLLKMLSNIIAPLFSLFDIPSSYAFGILSGIIELTNGLSIIANITNSSYFLSILFCSFLLGFGGISIMLQVFGILSETDISFKPYIIGKILQGIISSIYTYLFLTYFPFYL